MKKYFEFILIIILGLLVGFIIHGLIEIPALWLLRTRLSDLFARTSWNTWLKIHLIFTIVIEILGIALVFGIYKKYGKIR